MNYKIKRLILSAILLAVCIFTLSGCFENDGKNYIFKYDISGNPRTLDPQTVRDSSGLELIANIFDGLLRLDEDGDTVPAVAKSYTVSEDGLIYTFLLRDDVYWSDGDEFKTQCTAHDFVFSFQRLIKPSTKSQSASDFYCIKNAQKIHSGQISDVKKLGVEAIDDFTLKIVLEYPNPTFPILLTTAPAMPCNQEFYESCNGRYGLYDTTVASNGAFYLHSWVYDQWSKESNYIILRRNPENNADESICPYGLNFFIDEKDPYGDFTNGSTHVYLSSGDEAITLLEDGYSYDESDNSVWGIMFNLDSVFSNEQLRRALAYSIDRSGITYSSIGFSKAYSIIPDTIRVGGTIYNDDDYESFFKYDSVLAKQMMDNLFESVSRDSVNGLTILCPDDESLSTYLSYVTQQWQSKIGFFCNISTVSQKTLDSRLEEGDFDFAFVRLSGDYNSPSAYLSSFRNDNSKNYSGHSNSGFDDLLKQAEREPDEKKAVKLYMQAEEFVIDKALFIPICYQSEYAFYAEGCEDIRYNPFSKTVTFREAKYFD